MPTSLQQRGDAPGNLTPTEYEQPLQHHLHLQPPSPLTDAPPALSFERLREVEIPWEEVFAHVETDPRGSVTPIREYFERSWNLADGADLAAPDACVIEVPEGATTFSTVTFEPTHPPAPAQERAESTETKLSPVEPKSVVLQDGYGRHHLCKAVAGEEITKNDLVNSESYASLWTKKLQGVELCFATPEDAARGHTRVEYIDLAERFILESWDQLKAHRDFDDVLQDELNTSSKEMIQSALSAGLDFEQINRVQQSVMSLRLGRLRAQRQLDRLAQKAAELGYFLALKDEKERKSPSGQPLPDIEAGKLYRKFKRVCHWTTTIDRVECTARRGIRKVTSFFGIESPQPKRWQEKKAHSEVVDDWAEVDANENALVDKVDELKKGHEVFVFDKTAQGYVTAEGTSLREVMLRCERDEAFRCRCVVFIPAIEKALSGSQVISGYHVFYAPFPGIVPVAMPKLSVCESLSYRMAWQETQLGEVVNSINLAPGESRTVTVRRAYERETVYTQKRTTIFDLQETETTDIASEMEREITNEKESGFNYGASQTAGASAPIEGVNVESSRSRNFGYNQSLKSFNKTLAKVAKKASSTVNRSYKDEVTTDTRQTTKISNYDEYTSAIKNINEGRTLNLLFYRLYNRYRSGLYLDDLRFLVTPSVEIIAGSGIHDSVCFDTADFDRLLDEFRASRVPFEMDETNELRYLRTVIQHFSELIDKEYAVHRDIVKLPRQSLQLAKASIKEVESEEKLREELGELESEKKRERDKLREKLLDATRSNYEEARTKLKEHLEGLKLEGNAIQCQDLQIVARGLYVDALVGAVPSTETYSERMREQTVAMKGAEVALTQADAHYRESLAHHLNGNHGNWIVGIMPCRELNTLSLALKFPLASGKWDVEVNGTVIGKVPEDQLERYQINLKLDDGGRECLNDDNLLNLPFKLHDREKGIVLSRV